jgi:hypothetical protein
MGWKNKNETNVPGPSGAGSNNMGALTIKPLTFVNNPGGADHGSALTCPANGFPHKDSRRDLKTGQVIPYVTCFRISPTPGDGFSAVARTLFKSNVLAATAQNDLRGVATAMRDNSYYLGTAPTREGQIDAYLGALKKAMGRITADTHEINVFDQIHIPPIAPPVNPPLKSITPLLVGASLVMGFLLVISNTKSWQVQVKPRGAH